MNNRHASRLHLEQRVEDNKSQKSMKPNFNLAVYFTVYDVKGLAEDPHLLQRMAVFEDHMPIDHAYLETFRSGVMATDTELEQVKKLFTDRGMRVSGGITTTRPDQEFWKLLCYTNPADVALLEQVVRLTASHFDAFVLDDFFYTDCRCAACFAAKGSKSFREYRLALLCRMSEKIVSTARSVNPNIRATIKFPNWYPSHSFTGYNPREERMIFDQIYTGTETRNRLATQQSLPRYLSYCLFRYMENIAPGRNAGGWFDAFDCSDHRDFVEQGVFTLLAGAEEITLFCFGHIREEFLPVLGRKVKQLSKMRKQLEQPLGISCYLPFNSFTEPFLPDYLGMIGMPIEPTPEFDPSTPVVLLTEAATADDGIVEKMHDCLGAGHTVITTAGFWKKASGMGGETFRSTGHIRKAHRFGAGIELCGFRHYFSSCGDLHFQEISSPTNDAWTTIAGFDGTGAFPVLIKQNWGDGTLYVLNLPYPFFEMTALPVPVLDEIRKALCVSLPVSLRGDAEVALFVYDNDMAVVHSVADHNTQVSIVTPTGKVICECMLHPGEMRSLSLANEP